MLLGVGGGDFERVAETLVAEDEPVPQNGPGIVRAHGLVQP